LAKAYDRVLPVSTWLPAPGEAVMAKATALATQAAAAILTIGLLMILGLNIGSPLFIFWTNTAITRGVVECSTDGK
jgi:hypothetical protein